MKTSDSGGPSDCTPDSKTKSDTEWKHEHADSPPRRVHTLTLKDKKTDGFKRFTIKRDADRPLQFDGKQCAAVEASNIAMRRTRIALYETKAGRFISEFRSIDALPFVPQISEALEELTQEPEPPPSKKGRPDIHKAAVFDSRKNALGWFRPGRLTNQLLEKLGLMEPEFIE